MPRPPNIPKRKSLNPVKLAPQQNQVSLLFSQGLALHQQGRFDEAQVIYLQVLVMQENHFDALQLLGVLSIQTKQFIKSVDFLNRALKSNPKHAACYSNKSIALKELGRFDEALASCDKAISIKPDFAEAYSNRGNALKELGRFDEALASCDNAICINPDYAEAYYNRGIALQELQLLDEALVSYDKAIYIKHDFAEVYSNRGNVLKELGRLDEALASYDKAIYIKHDFAEAYSNRGNVLIELKRYDDAIAYFDKALSLKSDIDWAYGSLIHLRMKICTWSGLHDSFENISKKVIANKKVTQPFFLLAMNDDSFLHKRSSEIYTQFKHPLNLSLGPIPKHAKKEKIRIAYFSPDFQSHPVSFLTSELFEIHDRQQF